MNEYYIIIWAILAIYTAIQLITGALNENASINRFITTIITLMISAFMLLYGSISEIGDSVITCYPATNTRVGDQLIIQSVNIPTQVISDMAFIDRRVEISEVIGKNMWGVPLTTKYTISTIKTEI